MDPPLSNMMCLNCKHSVVLMAKLTRQRCSSTMTFVTVKTEVTNPTQMPAGHKHRNSNATTRSILCGPLRWAMACATAAMDPTSPWMYCSCVKNPKLAIK